MALVNPNIALGFRMPEFTPRNALAEYAQIQQIQGGQQAQELNALKMQEAQVAVQERNALNQAYQAAYNPQTGAIDANALRKSLSAGGFGSKLPAIEKSLGEIAQQKLTQQKLQGEVTAQPTTLAAAKVKLLGDKLAQQRSFLDTLDPTDPNAPARYMQWHEANHADPDIGAALTARGITVDQSRDQILRAIAAGPQAFANMINQSKLGTEKFMEMNKPTTQVVDQSGQRQVIQIPGLGGTPTTVGTYADAPLPAAVEAQRSRIAKSGASNITNVQEKAEAGAFGKLLVDQYGDVSKAAGLAIKTLPGIEANLGALNKGFDTGFGTDAKKAGARILGALGVQDAERFAADAEMFQSNAINAVLQKQLDQKGPQTESDARRIEQVGAELAKTKDANQFILSLAKEQLKRDIDQRNFYDKWRQRTRSFDGAENAWFSGEGGKSLFDRPALKKFAPGAAPAASQIPGNAPAPARTAPAPAPAAVPQAAIDALRAGRGTDAQFDAIFGPGAAKQARGR